MWWKRSRWGSWSWLGGGVGWRMLLCDDGDDEDDGYDGGSLG